MTGGVPADTSRVFGDLGEGMTGVSEDSGGEASRVRRGVGGVPSTRQGPRQVRGRGVSRWEGSAGRSG